MKWYRVFSIYAILLLTVVVSFPHYLAIPKSSKHATGGTYSSVCTKLSAVKVALTRERGTNNKLQELILDLECKEIPCIAFQKEPGANSIMEILPQQDMVIITSPQAAEVFLESWNAAKEKPIVKIVTVGKGTTKPLLANGFTVTFEPSEATAKCLAKELPSSLGKKVLYPCSAIASDTLASDLAQRGFEVTRLETYRTVPATWTEQDLVDARTVDIVTFASPSTVKVWKERVGTHQIAVTIGPTSEKAAKEAGFTQLFSPEEGSQGLEVWAKLVQKVAKSLNK